MSGYPKRTVSPALSALVQAKLFKLTTITLQQRAKQRRDDLLQKASPARRTRFDNPDSRDPLERTISPALSAFVQAKLFKLTTITLQQRAKQRRDDLLKKASPARRTRFEFPEQQQQLSTLPLTCEPSLATYTPPPAIDHAPQFLHQPLTENSSITLMDDVVAPTTPALPKLRAKTKAKSHSKKRSFKISRNPFLKPAVAVPAQNTSLASTTLMDVLHEQQQLQQQQQRSPYVQTSTMQVQHPTAMEVDNPVKHHRKQQLRGEVPGKHDAANQLSRHGEGSCFHYVVTPPSSQLEHPFISCTPTATLQHSDLFSITMPTTVSSSHNTFYVNETTTASSVPYQDPSTFHPPDKDQDPSTFHPTDKDYNHDDLDEEGPPFIGLGMELPSPLFEAQYVVYAPHTMQLLPRFKDDGLAHGSILDYLDVSDTQCFHTPEALVHYLSLQGPVLTDATTVPNHPASLIGDETIFPVPYPTPKQIELQPQRHEGQLDEASAVAPLFDPALFKLVTSRHIRVMKSLLALNAPSPHEEEESPLIISQPPTVTATVEKSEVGLASPEPPSLLPILLQPDDSRTDSTTPSHKSAAIAKTHDKRRKKKKHSMKKNNNSSKNGNSNNVVGNGNNRAEIITSAAVEQYSLPSDDSGDTQVGNINKPSTTLVAAEDASPPVGHEDNDNALQQQCAATNTTDQDPLIGVASTPFKPMTESAPIQSTNDGSQALEFHAKEPADVPITIGSSFRQVSTRGTRAGKRRRTRSHSAGRGTNWVSSLSPTTPVDRVTESPPPQTSVQANTLSVPPLYEDQLVDVCIRNLTSGSNISRDATNNHFRFPRNTPVNAALSAAFTESFFLANEDNFRVLFDGERIDKLSPVSALSDGDEGPIVLEVFLNVSGGSDEVEPADEELIIATREQQPLLTHVTHTLMEVVDRPLLQPPQHQRRRSSQHASTSTLNPTAPEWVPGRNVEAAAMAAAAQMNNDNSHRTSNFNSPTPAPRRSNSSNKRGRPPGSANKRGNKKRNPTPLLRPSTYDLPTLRQARIALEAEEELWYNSSSGNSNSPFTDRVMTRSRTQEAIAEKYSYLPGLHRNTPLLDLDFQQMGTLVGICGSTTYIEHKMVPKIREAFIDSMRALLDGGLENLTLWKKFFLLPLILFTSGKRRVVRQRLELLKNDNWDNFTLGSFPHKNAPLGRGSSRPAAFPNLSATSSQIEKPEWSHHHKLINRFISHRNMSKAFKCLENGENPPRMLTTQMLDKLVAKHPPLSTQGLPDNIEQFLSDFHIPEEDKVAVTVEEVRAIIRKANNLTSPGIDKLRYEHLKSLIGKGVKPQVGGEAEFCELLTRFVSLIARGELPAVILPAVRNNSLLALPKKQGSDDIRPIGMGAVYRKIASIIVFSKAGFDADLMEDLLDGLDQDCVQRAFQRGACEHVPLQFQHRFDTNPEDCFWAADAVNAFNTSQKLRAMLETSEKAPVALPLLRQMYLGDSTGFVLGMEDGIQQVFSREGFHQGDVLGTWGFAMSIQPLLRALRQHLLNNGFWDLSLIRFFVDDGNFAAPPEAMLLIMQFLFEHGGQYGYEVSNVKGGFLLGRQPNFQTALQWRERFINTGFSEDLIQLHPDNIAEVNINAARQSRVSFGLKILGSYIGTDEYRLANLRLYVKQLHDIKDKLMEYPDLQGRWLLFSKCFVYKPYHIFRTVPPHLTLELALEFERMKRQVLASVMLLNPEGISDEHYSICNLSLANGGLGLHDVVEVRSAAFLSSMISFSQTRAGGAVVCENVDK